MTRRIRVYIAGPMSQGDRLHNLTDALESFRELIGHGYAPFCPQLTFFVDSVLPLPHQAWLDIDLPWVEAADAVLRLPGPSKGADMEVAHARERGVFVADCIHALLERFPPAASRHPAA